MRSLTEEQICELVRPHVEKAALNIVSIKVSSTVLLGQTTDDPAAAVTVELKGASAEAVRKKTTAIGKAMSKDFGFEIGSEYIDTESNGHVAPGQAILEFTDFSFRLEPASAAMEP